MDWIQQWQSKLNKQNGVAPLVRTGGSRHTGLAALPYRNIHREMEQQIESRQIVLATRGDRTFVQIAPEGVEEYVCEAISPINCEGDVIGAVVLLGQSKTPGMGEVERKLIQSASGFLGRQMGQ